MIKFYLIFFLLFTFNIFAVEMFERSMSESEIKAHRRYTSEYIYQMIRGSAVNKNSCNIKMGLDLPSFYIDKEEHSFLYTNKVYQDESRSKSNYYECILTSTKKQLICTSRLPGETSSHFAIGRKFVYLTIELDDAGNATSMHGKKTLETSIPFLSKTITEFKCDIQPPPVIKDISVDNKNRPSGKLPSVPSSEQSEKAGTTVK